MLPRFFDICQDCCVKRSSRVDRSIPKTGWSSQDRKKEGILCQGYSRWYFSKLCGRRSHTQREREIQDQESRAMLLSGRDRLMPHWCYTADLGSTCAKFVTWKHLTDMLWCSSGPEANEKGFLKNILRAPAISSGNWRCFVWLPTSLSIRVTRFLSKWPDVNGLLPS